MMSAFKTKGVSMLDHMTSDPFFDSLRPFADAMTALAAAAEQAQPETLLPFASSVAMRELSEEAALVTEYRKQPVSSAHSKISLLMAAADDHMRSLMALMRCDPVPIFGTAVIVRALLEASGTALWLLEAPLSTKERVARGWTETLFSWEQLRRLPADERPDDLEEKVEAVSKAAQFLGMNFIPRNKKTRTPPHVGAPRIGSTAAVVLALGEETGKFAYNFLSAIAHGTTYGLMQHVQTTGATTTPGDNLARFEILPFEIIQMWSYASIGYISAVEANLSFCGWTNSEWQETCMRTLQLFNRALSDERNLPPERD